jgi:hypothetical protein
MADQGYAPGRYKPTDTLIAFLEALWLSGQDLEACQTGRCDSQPGPDNPEVQIMDLTPDSGLHPVAKRLLVELQVLGDLLDRQVFVVPARAHANWV